ncbi:MAG: hypothetical protein HKL95_09775 [Phycisphaerae bacterium]|nr:hypothetical protein [Phycisphaerae bacterium]
MTGENASPIIDDAPLAKPVRPLVFPTPSVIVALLCTGGSLLVAAAGWQWGAVPSAAGWWTRVWLYVNLAMGVLWFLVGPALALRPGVDRRIMALVIRWLAMAVGSIPALWLAVYFGEPEAGPLWQCLGMQLGWAIFAFGIVAMAVRCGDGGTIAAGILSSLYLMGPLAWYLAAEFTQVSHGWAGFAPALDIFSAAGGTQGFALLWAIGFGVIGLVLTGWVLCFPGVPTALHTHPISPPRTDR